MYKIFINEKPFIISSSNVEDPRYVGFKRVQHDPTATLEHIRYLEGMSGKGLVMVTDDPDYAFKDFCTHFVAIEAAGGLVFNNKGEILLIKRMGKWDLPKGKIDGEETPAEAGLREVEEECGIGRLSLGKELPTSYHTYKMHNHRFLKVTYWFRMETDWDRKLIPQQEEHITDAGWFAPEKIDLSTLDTYSSIRDLIGQVLHPG